MTRFFSWFFSLLTFAAFLLLLLLFAWQSLPAWRAEGMAYVTENRWFFRQHQFGAAAMIYGSVSVSVIALAIAVPLGLGAAICTAEYLPHRLRWLVKAFMELLAGIPSVVYGLLGIMLLRTWVYDWFEAFEPLSGDTLLTAGLLLAVMVLPTIVTLSDDALRAVSAKQRHAARGLGLTHAETILFITLPQAAKGLWAALLLGLGRAMGETIAVFLVVGRQDNQLPDHLFSLSMLLEAGQTLTSKLGGAETNIAYGDSLHWAAITGLALLLLIITGSITWVGSLFRRRNQDA